MPDPTMPDWLHQRAFLSLDQIALVAKSRRWTFRELEGEVALAARRLITLGIGARDRVALLMRNSAEFAVLT